MKKYNLQKALEYLVPDDESMVEGILEHLENIPKDAILDNELPEFCSVWETVENRFTVGEFLSLVSIEKVDLYMGLGVVKTQEEWEDFLGRSILNDAEFEVVNTTSD